MGCEKGETMCKRAEQAGSRQLFTSWIGREEKETLCESDSSTSKEPTITHELDCTWEGIGGLSECRTNRQTTIAHILGGTRKAETVSETATQAGSRRLTT